jgi:hypothetical protein
MVRDATAADLDAIADMGVKFSAYTAYAKHMTPTKEELLAAFQTLLSVGKIFVADIDGKVVGFIGCLIHPSWFSPTTRIAMEMAWWMNEDHRGGVSAIRLVKAYEDWATSMGASFICMSDLIIDGNPGIGNMLGRLGYTMTERTHMKGIEQ